MKKPLLLSIDNLTDQMWGGHWIRAFKGLSLASGPVGESWELSAHPERPSRIETGPGVFISLAEVIRNDATSILGPRVAQFYQGRLPLITKFIDAADDLSVQVHPDDEHAPAGESGKSEAWLVLDVQPAKSGEYVYLGFDPAKAEAYATTEEFADAFFSALNQANSMGPSDDQDLRARAERVVLPFLNRVRVQAGDVFEVPPGTVHAIGRGVRLFEIQRASDVTYRVWDWNRPDAKERSRGQLRFRPLHIKEARLALNFQARRAHAIVAGPTQGMQRELIRDAGGRFVLTQIDLRAPADRFVLKTEGVFQGLSVIQGCVDIDGVRVNRGRTVLIPAAMNEANVTTVDAPAVVLRATVPI